MSNVTLRLVMASIKREKKQYLVSFVIMILSLTTVIALFNTLNNDRIIQQKVKEKLYGNWNICYEDINDNDIKIIKDLKDYEKLVNVELVDVLDQNILVANYQKDFFDMAFIQLTGNVPKNNNEIIVKKSIGQIGEKIDLKINGIFRQFLIVGTINNYDKYWCIHGYDYFTYQLSPMHLQTYIKGNINSYEHNSSNVVFNLFLESSIGDLFVEYNLNDDNYSFVSHGDDESKKTVNIFLVFVIVILLVGIIYTMNQRKERFLLLKSLGMSNRQVTEYIFYETVCLMLISLVISLVLGCLLSWFMSLLIFTLTGYYHFSYDLYSLIPYIGILFLMMLVATYFSYIIISFQSLDSLIHKKRRTKMKKYHKACKMNIFHLANREIKQHYSYMIGIIVLSIYLLMYTMNAVKYINMHFYGQSYNASINDEDSYYYGLTFNQKTYFDNDEINNFAERQFCNKYVNKYTISDSEEFECTISQLVAYKDNDFDDIKLSEGRMPTNSHECVIKYLFSSQEKDKQPYDIGDTLLIQNEENEKKIPFQVVGIIYYEDDSAYYGVNDYIEDQDYLLVLEDAILKDEWRYYYRFSTKKDITLFLNEKYDLYSFRKEYKNQLYFQSTIIDFMYDMMTIIIAFVFLGVVIKIFIEDILKDLKLLKCLGMTNKQALNMSVYIYGYCMMMNAFWFMVYVILDRCDIKNTIIVFIIYLAIMLLVFVSMMNHQIKKEYNFLPSDVKRYY